MFVHVFVLFVFLCVGGWVSGPVSVGSGVNVILGLGVIVFASKFL